MNMSGLSYHEWERSLPSNKMKLSNDNDNEKDEKIEKVVAKTKTTVQINEASEKVRKLCRICSSNGFISIQTSMRQTNMKVCPSSDISAWDISISQIIQHISGEEISFEDSLPQFICEHCLGYLQHAYEIRLKIISTATNLRFAQEIAKEDSVYLEESQIDQSRITKREIEEKDEENNEDSHFYDRFKGANIKINQGTTKYVPRAIEHKCNWCQKRVMSIKSLNDHMDMCEISIIVSFFSQLQSIFKMRESTRLTSHEFILHAVKLVFDVQKRLRDIVLAKNIDVDAITSEIPMQEVTQVTQNQPNASYFKRAYRNYQSPDNDLGYLSGGNSNFTPR